MATVFIPTYLGNLEFVGNNPRRVLDDGFYQLSQNLNLFLAFSGTVVSIGLFNFTGISVTKKMGATTRMMLDSVRILIVWGVSLAIGWQQFQALQILGVFFLVIGMCIYRHSSPILDSIGQKLYETVSNLVL